MESYRTDKKLVKKLGSIIKTITSIIDAQEIILFGSFARGEQKKFSSIDILIIAKTDLPFIERIKKIIKALQPLNIPAEPLVFTPDEFRQKIENLDPFIISAIGEGILIWSKGQKIDIKNQLRFKKVESEYKDLLWEVE